MKKAKLVLFCLTLAMCTAIFGGCSRKDNEGSTTDTQRETPRETQKETPKETQRETTSSNKETESSKGIINDIGDSMETMIDDVETMLDPRR